MDIEWERIKREVERRGYELVPADELERMREAVRQAEAERSLVRAQARPTVINFSGPGLTAELLAQSFERSLAANPIRLQDIVTRVPRPVAWNPNRLVIIRDDKPVGRLAFVGDGDDVVVADLVDEEE